MKAHVCFGLSIWIAAALITFPLKATTVPKYSFEQLTDQSEVVVSGEITRTWSAWDANHKFIWTHYEISVAGAAKGSPGATIEFAEPGGVVGELAMTVAGTVTYGLHEQVAIFLQRMPNGYLRTTGWGQGKFNIDANGRLHSSVGGGSAEFVDGARPRAAATQLSSLDGIGFAELRRLVTARISSAAREAK